ncbi:methyltransferase domain-containing protein [Epilithonimonas sp. JDS]|uniref:class I SAM-dependent methyltransferase n=1 Tax=Epilithonimonas sp. JDS TaxID=2902797 RepID=UPI001E47E558|nr:class I SAM-dependent methyltransferase [Epilithonimonas sp. JDS]MCD9853344.1 methyltransferase domain-containing protein [Epilithonimonas sp. JDS]
MEKYNLIGENYNQTRKADPFLTERIFHLLNLKNDDKILDIGCGTGNYTIALSEKGLDFIGIEPSEKMLNEAKSKSENVNWVLGNAEHLPFENKSFDSAIATLTIHHWKNLENGFSEVFRILKNEGQFLIFTSTSEQMKNYWLNHYFPEMMKKSIAQMPSFETIKNNLQNTGFEIKNIEKYNIKDDLQDRFLYIGKNNPKIYFDANIRKGISSFADLANKNEIEEGLKLLETDLIKGDFYNVRSNFKENRGDYIFVVAKKKVP